MPLDPWPDEPNEPNPEDRWGNPEHDLVENISISEPADPEFSKEAVGGEVSRYFWASVVLVNAAVFALSLGPMLIYFRGQWFIGLGLIGGGTLALGRTYRLYQQFKRESAEQEETDPEGDGGDVAADGDGEGDADAERNP